MFCEVGEAIFRILGLEITHAAKIVKRYSWLVGLRSLLLLEIFGNQSDILDFGAKDHPCCKISEAI